MLLQEHHLKGQSPLKIADIARKAFLHSHFMERHTKNGPISRLPLITISDANNELRDIPVCQPFHLELNFFNKENRVLHYPVRAFYLDGFNLMAYNISSGADNLYKKLYSAIPGNVECIPRSMLYSSKQHLFLVVFELSGATGVVHEVVLYWEQTDALAVNNKGTTVKGCDAAFMGPNDSQYAILDEDKTAVTLYFLQAVDTQKKNDVSRALDAESFTDDKVTPEYGPMQLTFDKIVDRIYSTPFSKVLEHIFLFRKTTKILLNLAYRVCTKNGHKPQVL